MPWLSEVPGPGLRDPKAVQGEQGYQRMLKRRAEPGGDKQRAELVAIQGHGVRLIVQPRLSHVGRRRVIQQFFPDRIPVEPGDGAEPPGDRGRARPAWSPGRVQPRTLFGGQFQVHCGQALVELCH
jgi:hypothetical protein